MPGEPYPAETREAALDHVAQDAAANGGFRKQFDAALRAYGDAAAGTSVDACIEAGRVVIDLIFPPHGSCCPECSQSVLCHNRGVRKPDGTWSDSFFTCDACGWKGYRRDMP
jgi:hypothetical protein